MAGERLYLGIDGGGSTCRARLTDATGRRLGEAIGGPANIVSDFDGAVAEIAATTRAALGAAGLDETAVARIHAGLGVAGGNIAAAVGRLARHPFGFAAANIASDAEIACRGAHGGADGAILVLGTGSQGFLYRQGVMTALGGWGFQLSDGGSGAVIGHIAARRALEAHEDLDTASPFTEAIMARFRNEPAEMLRFARAAAPRDWATLAPLIFDHAGRGDPVAGEVLAIAVRQVVQHVDGLAARGADRVALVGGLAASYRPHLPERFAPLLVEASGDALDGALALAGLKARAPA